MIAKEIKLDEVSYSTLISKSPNTEVAVSWLQEMKKNRLRPNAITFVTFINKFANNKQETRKELIDIFLFIFELGKDFGIREFRRLNMKFVQPTAILYLVEAIYVQSQKKHQRFMQMLLDKVKNDRQFMYGIKRKHKELDELIS